MSLAVVMSRALDGLQAPPVHVEVQLANGLPSFTLVGLAAGGAGAGGHAVTTAWSDAS